MNRNMLGAMLAGAAIGATLGILLSSGKGKGILKEIAKKTQGLADQLSEKIEEGKALLTDIQKKTTTVRNKVTQVSE